MNYQEALESAFVDELEKIGANFFSTAAKAWEKGGIKNLAKTQLGGSSLKTHLLRGAVGAVPGAVAGAAAAPEGGGIGGAIKGGLVGGAAGIAGGAALQHRALGRAAKGAEGLAARREARAILPKAGPALEKAAPAVAGA